MAMYFVSSYLQPEQVTPLTVNSLLELGLIELCAEGSVCTIGTPYYNLEVADKVLSIPLSYLPSVVDNGHGTCYRMVSIGDSLIVTFEQVEREENGDDYVKSTEIDVFESTLMEFNPKTQLWTCSLAVWLRFEGFRCDSKGF